MNALKFKRLITAIVCIALVTGMHSLGRDHTYIIGADKDYPPYSFISSDGSPAGFDIDMTRKICEILDMRYEFRLDTWDRILALLEKGDIDIIAGILYTESRSRIFDFSLPYSTDTIAIFVRKNSTIENINDLQDKELAILKDDAITESFIKANGISVKFFQYPTFENALIKLNSGIHDFCLAPYSLGMEVINKDHLRNLKVTGPVVNTVQYRFAVNKGNTALVDRLNAAIDRIRLSDEDIRLKKKWFVYTREEITFKSLLKYFLMIMVPTLLALLSLWVFELRREVRRQTDKIVKYNRELEKLATTDTLTGIYNRRFFYNLAPREFQKAKRGHGDLSVIMMDIDNFKKINDTYGHDAGDEVLKSLALKSPSILRNFDLFARIGGEEFIILLPHTGLQDGIAIAERLRAALASEKVTLENKSSISYTVSMGVSSFISSDQSVDEIIKRADRGLYVAKNKGKNAVADVM